AYAREAPKTQTAEEFEPLRQAQLDAARRLYGAHPHEMETLLFRATKSDDIVTFSLGCLLAVRLGLAKAEKWLDEAERRLTDGAQRMRPHPYPLAEGKTIEELGLDVVRLAREEVRQAS